MVVLFFFIKKPSNQIMLSKHTQEEVQVPLLSPQPCGLGSEKGYRVMASKIKMLCLCTGRRGSKAQK